MNTSTNATAPYSQEHINNMFQQLPANERRDIESDVRKYREEQTQLMDGQSLQYYVWQFYSDAVVEKHQIFKDLQQPWNTKAPAPPPTFGSDGTTDFMTPATSSTSFPSNAHPTASNSASQVINSASLNYSMHQASAEMDQTTYGMQESDEGGQMQAHNTTNDWEGWNYNQQNQPFEAPPPRKTWAMAAEHYEQTINVQQQNEPWNSQGGTHNTQESTHNTPANEEQAAGYGGDATASITPSKNPEPWEIRSMELQAEEDERLRQLRVQQEEVEARARAQEAQAQVEAEALIVNNSYEAEQGQHGVSEQTSTYEEHTQAIPAPPVKAAGDQREWWQKAGIPKIKQKPPGHLQAQSWHQNAMLSLPKAAGAPGTMSAARTQLQAAPKGCNDRSRFPVGLQPWIEKVYAGCKQGGGYDTKSVQKYLRTWINQYVQSKEIKGIIWHDIPIPTKQQMDDNVPPHTLQQGRRQRSPGGQRGRRKSYYSRSRSRSRRRRSKPRRSGSGSSSRSQRSTGGQEDWGEPSDWQQGSNNRQKNLSLKDEVVEYIDKRLAEDSNWHKEEIKALSGEIYEQFGVNAKRLKVFLGNYALGPYVYYKMKEKNKAKGKGKKGKGKGKGGGWSQWEEPEQWDAGEEDWKRNDRAQRFQDHLGDTSMRISSFEDCDDIVQGGILGVLEEMCSLEEAKEREGTRQLDKFEYARGCDFKNPTANPALCTKKYQRSSADKMYKAKETRTLKAAWMTMEFLMAKILDFEICPKVEFAISAKDIDYFEIYSYLRDRTRAIRVDLHVQQPYSTTSKIYIECHEACLRFELLSRFLCRMSQEGCSEDNKKTYDESLGMKAISQTIEPLLFAYNSSKECSSANELLRQAMGSPEEDEEDEIETWVSPVEPAIHRYVILLLISSPDKLLSHLNKLTPEIINHPLVNYALKVFAAYQSDDYKTFLYYYRNADFLSAVAMSPVVDVVRLRVLGVLCKAPAPQMQDSLNLSLMMDSFGLATVTRAMEFFKLAGLEVKDNKVIIPKRSDLKIPLNGALASEANDFKSLGVDLLLYDKYVGLKMPRKDIVLGSADPKLTPTEEATYNRYLKTLNDSNDSDDAIKPDSKIEMK